MDLLEKQFIIFGGVKITFICFRQLPINTKQTFKFMCHLIDGERLWAVVVEIVTFSADKTLDLHVTTFSVSLSLFKV